MKKYIWILSLMMILMPVIAFSKIELQIDIIHRRGIDKGLTLEGQLSSLEIMTSGQEIKLEMKESLNFIVGAKYIEEYKNYGPNDLIQLKVEIYNKRNKLITNFKQENLIIQIGKKKELIFKDNEQLIEITIIAKPV
jgi:hypothetical protein